MCYSVDLDACGYADGKYVSVLDLMRFALLFWSFERRCVDEKCVRVWMWIDVDM